ncbi:hypothetical protein ACFOD0_12800 [Shewanella intestini]|uniref:Uncharacterized protein n=1 Tax=Shewanella intestini TaxID=2017544 RepID=A0ABS5I042_9GAMM|nr:MULTISPECIES: hypothetical protein [Shewanella]MBR9727403.1 hypothetical protein [Shewanella intestini]MRG35547.1 hypothetical protein [Shewanella sp. XMDDZSB0408]
MAKQAKHKRVDDDEAWQNEQTKKSTINQSKLRRQHKQRRHHLVYDDDGVN